VATLGDAQNYWVEASLVGVDESRAIVRGGGGNGSATVVKGLSSGVWGGGVMELSFRFDYETNLTGMGGAPLYFGLTSNPGFGGVESGAVEDDFIGVVLTQRITGSNESRLAVVNGVDGYLVEVANSAYENLTPGFYEIVLRVSDRGGVFDLTAVLNAYSNVGTVLSQSELVTAEISDLVNSELVNASALYIYMGGEDSRYRGIASVDQLEITGLDGSGVLAAPSGLYATDITMDQVSLAWSDNSSYEDGFVIERRLLSGSFSILAEVGAGVVSYVDTTVSAGAAYEYRVKAVAAGAESAYSNLLAVTVPSLEVPLAPSAPVFIAVSDTSIGMSWTDNADNEDGLLLYRSVNGGAWSVIATLPANSVAYTDYDIQEITVYDYYLTAENAAGSSAPGGSSSMTTSLRAPSELVVSTQSSSSIQLSWRDNSLAESGFAIQRRAEGGSYATIATTGSNETVYTDNGLAANTVYYYQVKALSGVSDSDFCNAVSGTTSNDPVPAGPSGLASLGVTSTSISLSWSDNADNESGYVVERSIGVGYSVVATLAAGSTGFTDFGLDEATIYSYRVKAFNGSGDSAYSSILTLSTNTVAPSGLAVSGYGADAVSLVWSDNSSNETGFEVSRQVNGGSWSVLGVVSAGATAYADSGLSASTVYGYRVRTMYVATASAYSNVATVTTSATPPPAAPGSFAVVGSDYQSVTLSWVDNSEDEVGFRIERKSEGGSYAWLANVAANGQGYTDSTVSSGSSYTYRVYAFNDNGDSAYSNESGVTVSDPPAPEAPSQLTVVAQTLDSIELNWMDNSANEDGFKLERSRNGSTFGLLRIILPNETSYINGGLSADSSYSYRIKSFNTYGESAYSNITTGTTQSNPPPDAPGSLVSTAVTHDSVSLAWVDNSSDEDGFLLQRSDSGSGFATIANLTSNTTTYQDTGLSPLTGYAYLVKAVNAQGESAASNQLAVTTDQPPPPDAPASLSGSALSSEAIVLNWSLSTGAESYVIEVKVGDGFFTGFYTASATETQYTDYGMTANTSYVFRILARSEWGDSAYTVSDPITTPLPDPPDGTGSFVANVVSEQRIDLSWADLSNDETGFRIERRSEGTSYTTVAELSLNSTNWTDNGLSAGMTYDYRIFAYNEGGDSVASEILGVETPSYTAPDAPQSLALVNNTYSQVKIGWSDVSDDESGFRVERSTGSGSYLLIATLGANVSNYTDNAVGPEFAYTYRVRAYNEYGDSAYSNELALVTPQAPAPETPSGLQGVAVSAEQVSLSWVDASEYETGFRVERDSGGGFVPLMSLGENASNYEDTTTSPLSTYRYRVFAYNASGDSAASNIITLETPAGALPLAVSGLSAQAREPQLVVLSWTDNADNESGMRVERSDNGAGFTTVASLGANAVSYNDTSTQPLAEYSYRIVAFNGSGDGGSSNVVSVTTPPEDPPLAPSGLTAGVLKYNEVNLSWVDNADDEAGFRIYRSTSGAAFEQIADVAQNYNSFADVTVLPEQSYSYRIAAYSEFGESDSSNTVQVNTPAPPAPSAPASLVAEASGPELVQLSWVDRSEWESGFEVQRMIDGASYVSLAFVDADKTC